MYCGIDVSKGKSNVSIIDNTQQFKIRICPNMMPLVVIA